MSLTPDGNQQIPRRERVPHRHSVDESGERSNIVLWSLKSGRDQSRQCVELERRELDPRRARLAREDMADLGELVPATQHPKQPGHVQKWLR